MPRRSTTSPHPVDETPTDPKRSKAGSEADQTLGVVEQAQEATEQVQQTVLRLSDSLRQQAVSQLGERKEKLAGGLETMSLALRTAGSEVRRQDNPLVAQYIEGAAGRLETLSGSLRENEVDALTAKVEQVARERPTLFLATTLGAGLLASRLFKTSSRNQAERDRQRERREEERQKHLREEEEQQRAAAAREAEKQRSDAADVAAYSDTVSPIYQPADMGAGYGVGASALGSELDDVLAGVPPAPGYGTDAGQVDEDALTSALLDPTGLGVTTGESAFDVEDEVLGTADPDRTRS